MRNSGRIAENTILLYMRTLLVLVVSLFTSRIVLNQLGVNDYGIYNVVGGIVAMFSLLSGSLSSAISRFITFELGKRNNDNLKGVFRTSVTIQAGMSVIVFILLESIGVWFLNEKMNIAPDRIYAANWVLQCSILAFIMGLISVPYNAVIIAHEHMSAFAYISIVETLLKLGIVYLLSVSLADKLISYAILLVIVSIIIRLIYGIYCNIYFEECRKFKFGHDFSFLKQMGSFAGWNFLGAGSYLLMTQGVNILMNLFFNVSVNAARGIATQVDNAVMGFVTSFTTAINPQITKSYASGDKGYMFQLICYGAKYSFFLVLIFAVPILFETENILKLWLKIVPGLSADFLRMTLSISLFSVLSNTLVTSMLATGDIKKYQIVVGGTGMLVFPLVYVCYKLGMPAITSYFIQFGIFVVQLCYRLILLRRMIGLSISFFALSVLLRVTGVSIVSVSGTWLISQVLPDMTGELIPILTVCLSSAAVTLSSIYVIGLVKSERTFVNEKVKHLFLKIKK